MANKKRERIILARYKLGFTTNPLRIIFMYLVVGFGWIFMSDTMLYALALDKGVSATLQSYKGFLYVLITAFLMYVIIKKDYKRILDLTASVALKNEELTEYSNDLEVAKEMLVRQLGALNDSLDTINAHKDFSQAIYDNTNAAIVTMSIDGDILDYNQCFTDLFGYAPGEIVNQKWHEFLANHDEFLISSLRERLHSDKIINNYECQAKTKDGRLLEIVWNNNLIKDPNSNGTVVICIGIDRTSEKQTERRIYELAFKDRLTKLDNQLVFERQVAKLIEKGLDFTLYYLDFDNFRNLNDIHGHYYGDCFLQDYARMLQESFETIEVFRFGGDEFMLLDRNSDALHANHVLSSLFKNTSRSYVYDDFSYYPSISVGVVKYPEDGNDWDTIFKNIDLALYKAKTKGKNQAVKFHREIQFEIETKIRIENGIRQMLLNDDFISYYQPIYDFDDQEIAGVESLLRWDRSILDCNPAQLVSVAEQTGQIIKIDRWVIDNSFRFMAENLQSTRITMSINLSTKTIESAGMMEFLLKKLSVHGIDPARIIFEITEHSLFDDIEFSRYQVKKLKAIGFKIALDDFGTRYSSLNYLKNLEFDRLKIDKEYIDKINESQNDRVIVEQIITLANKLDIETVAEGIECPEQFAQIKSMGCTYAQGYLLARPQCPDDLLALLNEENEKSPNHLSD
ncbi:MAG: EAL domain-containing protein [Erysipelotrichaceae bacterium]|nr:EAL domain-containing protein [Erysipelotrichaceae bacterium]